MPIEYPTGYKVQVPQSEIIRENVNEALQRQIQERDALASNVKGAYSEREANKKSMMDALERMRSLSDETYQSPEIDAQIKTLSEKSSMPDLPERSALADIISLFGAPVLGAMTGEAGALAQVPAGRAARDIYEGAHKQEIERVKLLKENTEKKVKALIDMKKASQDSFDKSQARQLEKVKAELGATKELTSMSADDLKNQEEKLFRLNDAITEEIGDRATDIAKMDRSKWESEQKTKRAPRFQKPLKAGEVAGVGDPLPGFTWNRKTSFTPSDLSKLQSAAADRETFNNLMARVADKVQNATKLELSNPASGVRRSIESDLADAQLLYKGDSFAQLGVLTGPDVSYLDKVLDPPNFANAVMRGGVESVIERYKSATDRVNKNFESKLKYKGFTPNKPLQGMNLPPKKVPKEIKTVNGVEWEKVQGGWKRVK